MYFLKMMSSLAAALLLAMVFAAGAWAQTPPPYLSYSAKFTCGTEAVGAGDDVVDGVYATSINIHNPQANTPVGFTKKIVVTQREGQGFVHPIILTGQLEPDLSDYVDCTFIFNNLPSPPPPYVEGFVVLQVPPLPTGPQPVLDVVAKYTAEPVAGGGVSTQNVVQINGQPIAF